VLAACCTPYPMAASAAEPHLPTPSTPDTTEGAPSPAALIRCRRVAPVAAGPAPPAPDGRCAPAAPRWPPGGGRCPPPRALTAAQQPHPGGGGGRTTSKGGGLQRIVSWSCYVRHTVHADAYARHRLVVVRWGHCNLSAPFHRSPYPIHLDPLVSPCSHPAPLPPLLTHPVTPLPHTQSQPVTPTSCCSRHSARSLSRDSWRRSAPMSSAMEDTSRRTRRMCLRTCAGGPWATGVFVCKRGWCQEVGCGSSAAVTFGRGGRTAAAAAAAQADS
jgi:hypothetical protein